MRPHARNATLVKNDDLVGMHDGCNALRDDDDGFAAHARMKSTAQRSIGLVVKGREAVVEQVSTGVGCQGAGNGEPLTLTTRHVAAALGDKRIDALVLRLYELGCLRDIGRLEQRVVARALRAVSDIRADGPGEQERVLRRITKLGVQIVLA